MKSNGLTFVAKELTNLSAGDQPRQWAEVTSDTPFDGIRISALGWLPRKQERITFRRRTYGLCVLVRGSGTFRVPGAEEALHVRAPAVLFTAVGDPCDYGPEKGSRWDEFFWSLNGPRVDEWKRLGWWPERPEVRELDAAGLSELWELFSEGRRIMEGGAGRALDGHKLNVERWLCAQAGQRHAPPFLGGVVEAWRKNPEKHWSLREAAARAGRGYTQFRVAFREHFGTSPYDYLMRLRLELAASWLRGTDQSVKAIGLRCGFKHVETFSRAFARVYGTSPRAWRRRIAG